jgi:tripartite-type tricarboxylate transporter receptor subunit TctC
MSKLCRRSAAWVVLAAVLCHMYMPVAAAQAYPTRSVRLVTPWPPGGGTDIFARTIAQKLTDRWGVPVIVDNRSGANGNIGAATVAKSSPDGYTLLMTTIGLVASRSIYKSLSFDLLKDFAPVTLVASAPFVLVVHPSLPVHSVKELIALAKANPGKLNYASGGKGGPLQLSAELFKLMTGVKIEQIPYQGTAPAITGLLGGEADMAFANLVAVIPLMHAGKLRALGITSAKRSTAAQQLPTISEAGVPGYDLSPWFGVWAPGGTPKDIVEKIGRDVVATLNAPEVKERLSRDGAELIGSTPDEFATFIRAENDKLSRVIEQAHIRSD